MNSTPLTAPVPAALVAAFQWAFTACATVAPMALVAFAFLFSNESLERGHLVVVGFEAILAALAAIAAAGAFVVTAAKSEPLHQLGEGAASLAA